MNETKKGSLIVAVLVGFILMIILGWIPLIGPFIAGLVAGYIAKGGLGRGALAGFLSGIVGGIILGVIVTVLSTAALGPLGLLIGAFAGLAAIILSLGGAIIALLGGLVGGAIAK